MVCFALQEVRDLGSPGILFGYNSTLVLDTILAQDGFSRKVEKGGIGFPFDGGVPYFSINLKD